MTLMADKRAYPGKVTAISPSIGRHNSRGERGVGGVERSLQGDGGGMIREPEYGEDGGTENIGTGGFREWSFRRRSHPVYPLQPGRVPDKV